MKRNQIRLLFAAVAAVALFCQSAGAFLVLQDLFQYNASGRLGDASTGQSYVPPWKSAQNNAYITNGSGSLVGTNLGLVESFGDKVNLLGLTNGAVGGVGVQNGCYNLFTSNTKVFDPQTTTNVYTSFLYRFKNGYDLTNGNIIAQMNYTAGGIQTANGATAYWQLIGRWTGTQVQLGIAKNIYNTTGLPAGANSGVTNWDGTLISPGQTFFVVVRLQLNATNASNVGGDFKTNAIDDLWINPAPATFSVAEGSVPAPDVSSPIGDGTIVSSANGPGRFFIPDTYAVAALDELRIGTTWADVTPYFGQCVTVSISTSPTNVTQSAEIPAILSCSYAGTGATNQWQVSKDNGATWSSISGAIATTYITPNLQLPGDNLSKYRCLVGVPCDGSSATSLVATVTLNATTPTSPGVIMNDAFLGPTFNYPVTPVNSVWFSLLDANQNPYFSDYPGPGATATTITNTSTLYVGYFVNSNAPPVDLAIGSAIRVTFPFTPNDFSMFTVNGPLRFGLFDYRDLGAQITTSSTALTGSAGQGYGVMGYLLDLNFGTNFTDITPLNLYVRNSLLSPGLASSTGDYLSLTAGPVGGVNTNANVPSFQDGVSNTLIFTVTRTATNACAVAVTITNANGLNISYSAVDTSGWGWHRFDSFALRPNSGVTTAGSFFIPSFKVEVIGGITVVPTGITITNISRATNSIILGWQAVPSGGTYGYSVLVTTNLSSGPWVTNVTGITATTYTDNNTISNNINLFYRVRSP